MKIFLSTEYEDLLKNLLIDHGDLLITDPRNADLIICTDLVEGLVRNNDFPRTLVVVITCVAKGTQIPHNMSIVETIDQFLEAS